MALYLKKKLLVLIIISLFLSFLGTFSIACFQYIRAEDNKGKNIISSESITTTGLIKQKKGGYIIPKSGGKIVVRTDNNYINKFSYSYQSDKFSDVVLSVYGENIYGMSDSEIINDSLMPLISRSVVNIRKNVSKIEIEFSETEKESYVSKFRIDNSFKLNPLLEVFLFCIIFIGCFLIMFRKENSQKLSIALFVCIIVSSTCMLLLQPIYITGWDEEIHFRSCYELGVTKKGEYLPESVDYLVNNYADFVVRTGKLPESVEERLDMIRLLNRLSVKSGNIVDERPVFNIQNGGYLFQALFLKITTFLHFPFWLIWLSGKFANILLYAIIMSLAIHVIPIGKRLLFVISLMPSMIFINTIYTYDTTVTAFTILGICILIREFILENERFTYKNRIIVVICICLGCLPKAVYAPLILIALFLKKDKFYSSKDCYLFKGIILFTFILLMLTFVLPTLISPETLTDSRGGNTSVSEQLHLVLNHIFGYAAVLFQNIFSTLENHLFGNCCYFAYLGQGTLSSLYAILIMLTILTDTYSERQGHILALQYKVLLLGTMAVVIALIWTAMYLGFTEVGETVIQGVQPRYYYPLLFGIALCLQTDKVKTIFSPEKYQMFIAILSSSILFRQIYLVFLVQHGL